MTCLNGWTCRINLKKKNGKMPGGSTKLSVSVFRNPLQTLCVAPCKHCSTVFCVCSLAEDRQKLDIEYFSKLLEKILEVQKNKKKLKSLAEKNSPRKNTRKPKGLFVYFYPAKKNCALLLSSFNRKFWQLIDPAHLA